MSYGAVSLYPNSPDPSPSAATSHQAPGDNRAYAADDGARGVACAQCGVLTHADTARTTPRTTHGGTHVDVSLCADCARVGSELTAQWADVIATRRPHWKPVFPWQALARVCSPRWSPHHVGGVATGDGKTVTADVARLHPYITDPLDRPPPQDGRWGHVSDDQLAMLRLACEREHWPALPPEPVGEPMTRPAVEAWPEPTCCWRCGVSVPRGEGTVIESPSPTDRWQRADRLAPPQERRAEPEIQERERARTGAPRVPGAAWRQCTSCGKPGPVGLADRAHGILATVTTEHRADVAAAVTVGAIQIMPYPVYVASGRCQGQTDPGHATPYGWYDSADWWAGELTRQVQRSQPPQAAPHPSGLRCQVCGGARAVSWELLNGFPLCGGCGEAFAPPPPAVYDTTGQKLPADPYGTRQHDNRPYFHPRGRWTFTWDTSPAPPDEYWHAMSWDEQQRWDAEHSICDLDLICAHAAGHPNLVRPGLARAVGFYLAKDHPDYRRDPQWKTAWSYLADHPNQTGRTLADTVAEVLNPTPVNAPERAPSPSPSDVAHRQPSLRTAAELRAARRADTERRQAARADAARMRTTPEGVRHG